MKLKALIIEDEPLLARSLKRLLEKNAPDIEVIAQLQSVKESKKWFKENNFPELIFADIQLSDGTSFDLFAEFNPTCPIIFTTAYEEYAIKAFQQNSIDYLLKPIEAERLNLTIQKIKRLKNIDQTSEISKLLEFINQAKPAKEITAMPVKIGDKILLIKMDDIAYFEAKEKYVFIHTIEGKELLIDYTLTSLEEKLPKQFLRVHRAFTVNKGKIKEIQKYFDGKFVLKINDKVDSKIISGSTYTKEVRAIFEI